MKSQLTPKMTAHTPKQEHHCGVPRPRMGCSLSLLVDTMRREAFQGPSCRHACAHTRPGAHFLPGQLGLLPPRLGLRQRRSHSHASQGMQAPSASREWGWHLAWGVLSQPFLGNLQRLQMRGTMGSDWRASGRGRQLRLQSRGKLGVVWGAGKENLEGGPPQGLDWTGRQASFSEPSQMPWAGGTSPGGGSACPPLLVLSFISCPVE